MTFIPTVNNCDHCLSERESKYEYRAAAASSGLVGQLMGVKHNFKELFKIHKFDIEIEPERYGVPKGGTRGVVMREFEMALDNLAISGYAGDEITVTIRKR